MSETTIDLPVLGMTCAACVRRVERAVGTVPGVSHADVNLLSSRARIVFDPAIATLAKVAAAIRDGGYEVPADVIDGATTSAATKLASITRAEHEEVHGLRRDAAIAIALAVPLIVIAMTLPASTPVVITQLVLGTLVVLGPGRRYLRGGWIAVRHRAPDMNTLIALGAGAAWLSSTIVTVRWLLGPRDHGPDIYFEAGAAIVAFVMIGKVLESRARERLSEAVRALVSLAPARARKLVDGAEIELDAAALAPGDAMAVRPGERLAADGTIVEGSSALDESLLTGESLPVDKTEGAPVYAGTLNVHGALVVRVARAGADTALAHIARAVEDAQGSKAPIARLADRVSAWFVPSVLAIAGVTFVAWEISGAGAGIALERMIAVLVIACPCALGLATPAAVAVGTSRGAELGVLFKGGAALEIASHIDVVCVDKTGTLTAGHPVLVGEIADDRLRLVASAEQASEHPIARAIVDGAKSRGLVLVRPTDVTIEPGAGVTARVDGHVVRVGTRAYVDAAAATPNINHADPQIHHSGTKGTEVESGDLNRQGAEAGNGSATSASAAPPSALGVSAPWRSNSSPSHVAIGGESIGTVMSGDGSAREVAGEADEVAAAASDQKPLATSPSAPSWSSSSLSYVSIDGESAGTVAVADVASPDARDAIAKLRAMNVDVVMVTGDRDEAAQAIAREVGITKIHAGVRPTAKAAIVAGERWGGHQVAMVGDGINDAPALAAADLGVAIGSGADLAAAAGDVTLLRGGIATLPIALQLARATLHTIRRNLIAAFAYNAICIPIAAAGLLSPMLAAAAMSLSSVSVLVSSLRLRRFMR